MRKLYYPFTVFIKTFYVQDISYRSSSSCKQLVINKCLGIADFFFSFSQILDVTSDCLYLLLYLKVGQNLCAFQFCHWKKNVLVCQLTWNYIWKSNGEEETNKSFKRNLEHGSCLNVSPTYNTLSISMVHVE